jgi:hypothetical protein
MEARAKQLGLDEENAKPLQLIGSRAFENNFEISSKDWDVIIPHSTLLSG